MTLILYNHPGSTCSQKARLCLQEKGLDFEDRLVDLKKDEQLSPAYLALNPNGVVPTLVHDGAVIRDSSVIMEYLDEVFPDPPLIPREPVERARMRAWMRYIEEVPTVAIRYPTFNRFLLKGYARLDEAAFRKRAEDHPLRTQFMKQMGREGFSDEAVAEALRRLGLTAARMERDIGEGPWLMGADLTIADLALAPTFDRMQDMGLSHVWEGYPKVVRWFDMIRRRPAYDRAFYPGCRLSEVPAPA